MMQIRTLTEADVESYWALRLQALRDSPEVFSSVYEEQIKLPLHEVQQRLKTQSVPDNFIVVAILEDQFVGMTGVYRQDSAKVRHKANIWGVFVVPEQRGKGIARALLTEAIARARHISGVEQVHLSVITKNIAALSLYESLGFTTYGIEPHALKVNGVHIDEAHMMMFLDPLSDS